MKVLFLIVFCFQLIAALAQKKLLGSYKVDLDFIAQYDIRFEFYKDGSFVHEEWDDIGDYFGLGIYELSHDSLFLHYQNIPKQGKSFQIVKNENEDSLSSLIVVNSLSRRKATQLAYEVIEDKNRIEIGKSDALGRIYFSLEEGQYIKIVAYQFSSSSIIQHPLEFKISYENKNKDYVVFYPGVRDYTHFWSARTIAYPVKVYRKARYFGIKKQKEWLIFEKIAND